MNAELEAALMLSEGRRSKRKNKFGAVITEVDGIKFHSKREAEVYRALKVDQLTGYIERFHRQVAFDLGGGVRYLCDFMVIGKDGSIRYIDVKGVETKEFKTKAKLVKHQYGVEIEVWK